MLDFTILTRIQKQEYLLHFFGDLKEHNSSCDKLYKLLYMKELSVDMLVKIHSLMNRVDKILQEKKQRGKILKGMVKLDTLHSLEFLSDELDMQIDEILALIE